jgi:hypothetical protein
VQRSSLQMMNDDPRATAVIATHRPTTIGRGGMSPRRY